jgi:hypothetical protein
VSGLALLAQEPASDANNSEENQKWGTACVRCLEVLPPDVKSIGRYSADYCCNCHILRPNAEMVVYDKILYDEANKDQTRIPESFRCRTRYKIW